MSRTARQLLTFGPTFSKGTIEMENSIAKCAYSARCTRERFNLIKWTLEARQIEMRLANKRTGNKARRLGGYPLTW